MQLDRVTLLISSLTAMFHLVHLLVLMHGMIKFRLVIHDLGSSANYGNRINQVLIS